MAQNALSTQTILSPLRERPERLAWLVLSISFAIFTALAVTLPWAWGYTTEHYSVHQPARVEPLLGSTLLVQGPRADEPTVLTSVRDDVANGSRISTSNGSDRAAIKLVDTTAENPNDAPALGTIELGSSTELVVERLQRPLFARSEQPYQAALRLDQGTLHVLSNNSEGSEQARPLDTRVETPHGEVQLAPGSYKLFVGSERTSLYVYEGEARLVHREEAPTVVSSDFRALMSEGEISLEARADGQNLLRNSNFTAGLREWEMDSDAETATTPGRAQPFNQDGRRGIQFVRYGKTPDESTHANHVGITQPLEVNVEALDQLELQMWVRVVHQNLAGAGYQNTEFPLRVGITFTPVGGEPIEWFHGFYISDMHPARDDNPNNDTWTVNDSDEVPRGQWYLYESDNLLERWRAQGRPAGTINSIRLYASGHDYQSMVSGVRLMAE